MMKPEFWNNQLGEGWSAILADLLSSEYMGKLMTKVKEEYRLGPVYPDKPNVFRAFRKTPWENLRVVILGQDPYHNGSATGLAFANAGEVSSPSLRKIENLHLNYGINNSHFAFDPSLESWASQGVLLLNTALTVQKSKAGSHTKYWKKFTEAVLETISKNRPDCIFMLWGNDAKAFKPFLGNCRVLEYVHPAYACYKGIDWNCPNFNEANELLEHSNGEPFKILW